LYCEYGLKSSAKVAVQLSASFQSELDGGLLVPKTRAILLRLRAGYLYNFAMGLTPESLVALLVTETRLCGKG
jgi:hypothetical protein